MKTNLPYQKLIPIILLLVVAYFPLFHRLDANGFKMWDEAIYAINALEMSINYDFINRHYDGKPMMWNPKPPLVTWIQVISFKLFGYSELAFRLPIAIMTLCIAVLLLWFSAIKLKVPLLGYLSVLVLITSQGFIHSHIARTGDTDAPLTLFVLLYSLSYFLFLDAEGKRKKQLYFIFTIAIICAVMTKSLAGLIALPALLIWTIFQKKFKEVLSLPYVYVGIVTTILIVSSYYLIHEIQTPGFLESVMDRESGRFFELKLQHKGPFLFYINGMFGGKFFPWILIIPISLLTIQFESNALIKRFLIYASLIAISYIIVISSAKTKLPWYLAPAYPFLSVISAYFVYKSYHALYEVLKFKNTWQKHVFLLVFIISVFSYSYSEVILKIHANKENQGEKYSYFMDRISKEKPDLRNYNLVHSIMNPHITYYKSLYNYKKGYELREKGVKDLQANDIVMACEGSTIDRIYKSYEVEKYDQNGKCMLLKIKNPISNKPES